jgi:dolichol kinase
MLRFLLPLKSIYSIKRLSIGEILIGIGIAITAWFSESGSVFSAAVLIVSWSDSVAAIIGTAYGKKNSFKIFKSKKSVVGSSAFFVTTLGIVFGYYLYEYNMFSSIASLSLFSAVIYSVGISFILTLTELTGVYGSDNLSVPILSVVILNLV